MATRRIALPALPLFFFFSFLTLTGPNLRAQSDTGAAAIPPTVYIGEYRGFSREEDLDKRYMMLFDPVKMISLYNVSLYFAEEDLPNLFYGGGVMLGTGLIDDIKGFGFQTGVRLHASKGIRGWFGELGFHLFAGEQKDDSDFSIQLINGSLGYMAPVGKSFVFEISVGIDYILEANNNLPLLTAFTIDHVSDSNGKIVMAGGLGFGLRL